MNVIHSNHFAQQFETVQIVHSQDCTSLILIAQKSKSLQKTGIKEH
jgi:hypothetical protein